MVDLPIIPQDFAYWWVLLSNCKHPLWITAFCQQLPAKQKKWDCENVLSNWRRTSTHCWSQKFSCAITQTNFMTKIKLNRHKWKACKQKNIQIKHLGVHCPNRFLQVMFHDTHLLSLFTGLNLIGWGEWGIKKKNDKKKKTSPL